MRNLDGKILEGVKKRGHREKVGVRRETEPMAFKAMCGNSETAEDGEFAGAIKGSRGEKALGIDAGWKLRPTRKI